MVLEVSEWYKTVGGSEQKKGDLDVSEVGCFIAPAGFRPL